MVSSTMAQILSVCEKGKVNISAISFSKDRAVSSLRRHQHIEQVVYVLKQEVEQNNVMQVFVVELQLQCNTFCQSIRR